MSNTDAAPTEVDCGPSAFGAFDGVLHPREVPLGGPRAIRVRRTLPQRERSLIGAWCFADHYGPHDLRGGAGMDVPPHPHTGLQTVSWLFEGLIEHRDSAGVHAMVRPGELNLMTAGAGICHSEVSLSSSPILHGVQLWVALPDSDRDTGRDFAHHVPRPRSRGGLTTRVFLGEFEGESSPVHTFTPLLGAQLDLEPGTSVALGVDAGFEHGVLVDHGNIDACGAELTVADLGFQGTGHDTLHLTARGDGPARVLLLGGAPFDEELLMWWNFVGRNHDEIVAYREQWQAHGDRFGAVAGYRGELTRLPAPPLPHAALKPRPRPGV
ncbi:pirin family protein [Mycolicibacterium sp. 018/SC-01/001]|uniref:pirin family protein n=1 Tax=Mycolicibacterium sp. 018/SC-01/001 TaxID=2592069 RepID=UPI0011809FBD|nr:pirin family protein [Mycolicibacterium sp. 018/SC-01/001]TRW78204.1 pirin family protein [Mycolicibacterium sp. 018/SC-01/001]